MQDKFRNIQKLQGIDSIEDVINEHVGNRKVKKFFKVAAPVLVLEIIVIIALVVYLAMIPKNFCTISANLENAVIYVNNDKTTKFKFNPPDKKTDFYFYEVDISIELPGTDNYNVSYLVQCKKYQVIVNTEATKDGRYYSMQVQGGKKTQLISALIFKSDSLIKNFDVDIKINATKI